MPSAGLARVQHGLSMTLVCAGACLALACSGTSSGAGGMNGAGGSRATGGAGGDPPFSDVWEPTTVPYDPSCSSGCVVVEEGNFGHFGELEVLADLDVDDPIAQWGDCIESFTSCIDSGMDPQTCSEGSVCPEDCRADYEERIVGLSDLRAQLLQFQAVYVDVGAPCLPIVEESAP